MVRRVGHVIGFTWRVRDAHTCRGSRVPHHRRLLLMNTDRRRIVGPADAVHPSPGSFSRDAAPAAAAAPLLPPAAGPRQFFISSGLARNANGSAYLEVGSCALEVSVFGPRPIRGSFVDRASLAVETKFLPFLTQPNEVIFNAAADRPGARSGLSGIEHRMSLFLETAFLPAVLLAKYPKSAIDIFVNVLQFDAASTSVLNLLAWAVNCTTMALVDAGVEIRDMVTAGHVSLNLAEGDVVVDGAGGSNLGSECVASYMPMQQETVAFWLEDDGLGVADEKLQKLLAGCEAMANEVRANLNGYLIKAAERVLPQKPAVDESAESAEPAEPVGDANAGDDTGK